MLTRANVLRILVRDNVNGVARLSHFLHSVWREYGALRSSIKVGERLVVRYAGQEQSKGILS
jgi:hypothetical protein